LPEFPRLSYPEQGSGVEIPELVMKLEIPDFFQAISGIYTFDGKSFPKPGYMLYI
jgi:hypothetical protein